MATKSNPIQKIVAFFLASVCASAGWITTTSVCPFSISSDQTLRGCAAPDSLRSSGAGFAIFSWVLACGALEPNQTPPPISLSSEYFYVARGIVYPRPLLQITDIIESGFRALRGKPVVRIKARPRFRVECARGYARVSDQSTPAF